MQEHIVEVPLWLMSRVVVSEPDYSLTFCDPVAEEVKTDHSTLRFLGLSDHILPMVIVECAILNDARSPIVYVNQVQGDVVVSRDDALS